ncbi:DoxX family protein [Flavobacterium cerinum]|uniref:DoxX family membrane protein n=1 Tax=Flavobacterium cerinum TaxID=2502784 RepID=A0A3S3U5B7_9FLAO|nr:DoxX family protein [Flavobacterium cerinum]RWX03582.1 DoxX family membrane protein [Flavobacterium cerinum]
MNAYSFLIIRLAVGVSMLGHGLVRLPKLTAFSEWMIDSFRNSMLPQQIVMPFSYVLPVAEFTIGIMLILGLFIKRVGLAGGFVMVLLVFGSCLTENWEAVPSQLIHAAFFAVLIHFIRNNSFALDNLIKK